MPITVRGGRALKPNDGNSTPRYILAFDTETLPEDWDKTGKVKSHKLRLGVAIFVRIQNGQPTGEKVLRFTTADELHTFIHSLTGPRHTLWIVAHNLLFDFIVSQFPEAFVKAEYSPDWPRNRRKVSEIDGRGPRSGGLCCINSPPTIISCKDTTTDGRIMMVDSLNWFPCTLSEIGEQINRPKMKMPDWDKPDFVWSRYCENDARIVLEAFCGLARFVTEFDLGNFRYTAAGQSMAAFRHKYYKHKVYPHDIPEAKSIERRSYFGGRTSVFKMGEIHDIVYKCDVSSLFPACMAGNAFPYTIESYEQETDYSPECPNICLGSSVAECLIRTKRPIFPVRGEHGTIYPVGLFETVLAGPELQNAATNGEIEGIRSWVTYRTAELFTPFVTDLWSKRLEFEAAGNWIYAALVKRLLNSLYGKFGELLPIWDFDPDEIADLPWSKWVRMNLKTMQIDEYRSFGWQTQRNGGRMEKRSSFPAIASFVTSYARLRMNELRAIAGAANVYYQGVDSLIVTATGFHNLEARGEIKERELGYLRRELTTDNGEIRGAANYTLAGKHTIAGVALRNIDDLSGRECQRIFLGKSRLFDGKIIDNILETEQPWSESNPDVRGTVQIDGWVSPLELTLDTSGSASAGKISV